MLVNSKELMLEARDKKCAMPSTNFIDFDTAKSYTETAEELGVPIFLSYAQSHSHILSLEDAAVIGNYFGEKSTCPVILHLDHGEDFDFIKRAIDLGFTSVMIDASMESIDKNIQITKEIVDYAHDRGVTVEAELGHVGSNDYSESDTITDSVYTEVEDVIKFVEETNVDSLAISIGTAHGIYKGTPKINFERLEEISKLTDIPLVLHGGSSSGYENLERCALNGITKINIYSDFIKGALNVIKEGEFSDYIKLKKAVNDEYENIIKKYLEVFHTEKLRGLK